MGDARRSIPSVDRLLSTTAFATLLQDWPRDLVVSTLADELVALRAQLQRGDVAGPPPDPTNLALRVRSLIEDLANGSLVPVINATGVILHTNLGRAPLATAALDAILAVSCGYSNLEYDVAAGSRGSRYAHCRSLLCRLTGAEDALVVNNNAAALVLALNTLSRGMDAIVSRGELVEIGGAFRVPEIMERSGARLREVGSTNRTHSDDYRDAINSRTGAVLKVHPSNFTIEGYTADVDIEALATLAAGAGVPLIHDIGSGLLLEPERLGLPADEPTPRRSLASGASVVTMSGDKLLGGPQCGIILGSASIVERMRRNPLCRALRVDKLTLAALSATLRLYLDPERALTGIPVLRMLTLGPEQLEQRARAFAARCTSLELDTCVIPGTSAVGGGAAAAAVIATALLSIAKGGITARTLEERLRTGTPIVVTRIVDDRVTIDLRTVPEDDEPLLLQALKNAVRA